MTRYVRTPEGSEHFDLPIGAPIGRSGSRLNAADRVNPQWTAGTERQARELIRELVNPDADTPLWMTEEDWWEPADPAEVDRLVEERISETRDKVRSLLATAHVMVQISGAVLPEILRSGGLKTADDPDAVSRGIAARNAADDFSAGALEASLRARRELQANLFGHAESPVYGYLAATPHGAQTATSGGQPLGSIQGMIPMSYGDTALRLRRDRVGPRTTVTFGDSFAMTAGGGDEYLAPTPLETPDWHAAGAMNLAEVESVDTVGMATHASYVEHQVHGPVTLDDIEAVVFDVDPPRALAAALRERGIGVEVLWSDPETIDLPDGGFDEGTFDLTGLQRKSLELQLLRARRLALLVE